MLHPQRVYHLHPLQTAQKALSNQFGVMCWNIHKTDPTRQDFQNFLASLKKSYDLELFLWQEAPIVKLKNLHIEAAANIMTAKNHYGVVNASYAAATQSYAYLSLHKELFFTTHKSMLISTYKLKDNSSLAVFNIHAINFREQKAFDMELNRIYNYLLEFKGACIVVGDFNTWNKIRLLKLYKTMQKLHLHHVPFKKSSKVKSFGSNMLDHIFYRGLKVQTYDVITKHKFSDHQPLVVTFSY